ncbi:MAG: flagellar protein FlgN [Magnetococcales bacterium]|nr:flagellar protein FlgN [Magnetococcales bacterium]
MDISRIRELKQLLTDLTGRFEALRELMLVERGFLMKRRTQEVEETSRRIRDLLEEIRQEEARRQELVADLGQSLGLPGPTLTLKELVEALGETARKLDLPKCREKLKEAILQADEANKANKAVLRGIQAATQAVLGVLTEGTAKPVAYTRTGSHKAGNGLNLFSRQL